MFHWTPYQSAFVFLEANLGGLPSLSINNGGNLNAGPFFSRALHLFSLTALGYYFPH
ncbi:hypothetical protein ANRL1_04721 [Anaerolineae bacterium]|nr:hypothetical protein ANRL1_04721 [Anaerolineae bacterium]